MIKANRRNFIFEEVKQSAPERNGFDCSHENKQTARAGKLYPYEVFETLPNDDFEIQTETFIRLKPMLSPTMHRVKAYWHWFFVPCRLANTHWEEFISRGNGKKLPADQDYTPPELPTISMATLLECCTVAQRVKNVEMLVSSYSDVGDFDQIVTYLANKYPECIVRKSSYDTNKTCVVVSIRTPRIANALRIPDTCMPFFWVDNSKKPHWVYAIETEGEMTVNQLYNLGNIGDPVDIYGYYHSVKLSLLPFIATFRVWLEYYRDENLDEDYDDMLTFLTGLTGEWFPVSSLHLSYAAKLFELNYRCWEKDYFTTATQLPQKSPDVLIPGTGGSVGDLTAETSITGDNSVIVTGKPHYYQETHLNLKPSAGDARFNGSSDELLDAQGYNVNHYHDQIASDLASHLSAETTITSSGSGETLQPTTVAQVRRAFALQRWFEKVCRTGTRYIESLKAFFNSDAGDARLQRSEYIGGSSTPIQISDVVQTSATDDQGDTPQGNLAGYGVASDNSQVISYHAPEHGFIIGFFSILARTSYSQGIPKMFSRETWLDYAWPEFEHIGEQGIKQKELAAFPLSRYMVDGSLHHQEVGTFVNKGNDHIFGYQSRYAEYKQCPDVFGSGFSSSQDFWTLGRIFSSAPSLNKDFVHAQVSDRNFAVVGSETENPFYDPTTADTFDLDEAYDYDTYDCDFWVDCKKVTSLTLFSEPI